MSLHDVFLTCRSANPYLGFAAFVLLSWRLGPAMLWLSWQDRAARILFAGYIAATAAGAAQAIYLSNKVGPVTVLLTGLHVGVIVLMAVWKPTPPPTDRSGGSR